MNDSLTTAESGRIRISLVQFLSRQQAQLRGYAYAICGDHHVADDAVQELSLIVAADPHLRSSACQVEPDLEDIALLGAKCCEDRVPTPAEAAVDLD